MVVLACGGCGGWMLAGALLRGPAVEVTDPSGALDTADRQAPTAVAIVVHGDDALRDALQVQLEGALPRGVVPTLESASIDLARALAPAAAEPDTLARVWIELAPPGHGGVVTVVLVDGRHERVLVRHIAAPVGVDAVVRETVATLVASAIEALREGATIGVDRAVAQAELDAAIPPPPHEAPATTPTPPASPTIEPSPAPSSSTRRRVDEVIALAIEPGWSLLAWSRTQPIQHGPRLAFGIVTRDRWRAGAGVSGQYRLPARIDHSDVTLRLSGGALQAWVGLHPELTPRVRLRARVGAGVDLVRASVSSTRAGVRPRAAEVHPLPAARASLGVGVALARGLELTLDAALEVDLVDTQFVLQAPDRTVFDPWRARPGVTLALAWDPISPTR